MAKELALYPGRGQTYYLKDKSTASSVYMNGCAYFLKYKKHTRRILYA